MRKEPAMPGFENARRAGTEYAYLYGYLSETINSAICQLENGIEPSAVLATLRNAKTVMVFADHAKANSNAA